jgi:pyruvate,water dikinase
MPDADLVHGIAASPGWGKGRARLLLDLNDLTSVQRGDILVTRFATPDVVLAFDRIAGLVTDQGGRSAHAAAVARELGVPAVVGTQRATRTIRDGSTVSVDGTRGRVSVLGIPRS